MTELGAARRTAPLIGRVTVLFEDRFFHQLCCFINNSSHSRLSRLPERAVNCRPHLWLELEFPTLHPDRSKREVGEGSES